MTLISLIIVLKSENRRALISTCDHIIGVLKGYVSNGQNSMVCHMSSS
jgi:hypothetical protein